MVTDSLSSDEGACSLIFRIERILSTNLSLYSGATISPFVSILGTLIYITVTSFSAMLHLLSKVLTLPSNILLSRQLIRTCELFSTGLVRIPRGSVEKYSCFLASPTLKTPLIGSSLSPSDNRYWVTSHLYFPDTRWVPLSCGIRCAALMPEWIIFLPQLISTMEFHSCDVIISVVPHSSRVFSSSLFLFSLSTLSHPCPSMALMSLHLSANILSVWVTLPNCQHRLVITELMVMLVIPLWLVGNEGFCYFLHVRPLLHGCQ